MKNNLKKIYLALIGLIVLGGNQAIASVEDVAINPNSGDTFIIERTQNPFGKILLLNDHNVNVRKEIQILNIESEEAQFEIELNKKSHLTYLAQIGDLWMVNTIIKKNGLWEKQPAELSLSGEGRASDLTSLPDGRLAMTVITDGEAKVFLIENSKLEEGKKLTILEEISEEKISEVSRIVYEKQNIENLKAKASCEKEDDDCNLKKEGGFGFSAGMATGVGMAYRRHLANRWGYQITGIGWGTGSSFFVNAGVDIMKTLHKTKRTRFMMVMGASAFYSTRNEIDYDKCEQNVPQETWDSNPNYDPCGGVKPEWKHGVTINVGIGIGMEFALSKNIGLAIELPVVISLGFGEHSHIGIYPVPSLSLIYYF